jgi:hypothetical protein
MISKDSTGYDTGGHLTIWVDGGRVKVRLQSDSGEIWLQSDPISSSTWYHVALTFGVDGAKLYLDGTLEDSDSYTGALGPSSGDTGNFEPLVLGASSWTSNNLSATPLVDYFEGKIDELSVFNSQLSAAQVQSHYNSAPSVYYVRKSGNNANDGLSPATAWATVDYAADRVGPGDTVYVGAGTYSESVTPTDSGTSADPISFIADTTGAATGDAGVVRITATGTVLTLDQDNYYSFTRFTFTSTGSSDDAVAINDSVGISMDQCVVDNSGDDGFAVDDNAVATLSNCTATNCDDSGFRSQYGANLTLSDCRSESNLRNGLRILAGGTATVRRSVFAQNQQEGVYVSSSGANGSLINVLVHGNGNDGIRLDSAGSWSIWHSTFADNGSDGIDRNSGSLTVTNSIISGNAEDGLEGSMTHSYNLVYGNGGDDYKSTSPGAGEINVDPKFAAGAEYRLLTSSPAIDAGVDGSAHTSADLDGASRPQDAGWDMGCYEGAYVPMPQFVDVSSATSFDHQTTNYYHDGSALLWGDLNDDGYLDAVITGDDTLVMLSQTAASFTSTDIGAYQRGGALLDIDNDGDLDFYTHERYLFENSGAGSFSNAGSRGFDSPSNTEGIAAGDFNADGWPDLAIFAENGNWLGHHDGAVPVTLNDTNSSSYGLNDSGDEGNGDYVSTGDVNSDGRLDFFYHYGSGKLFLSDGDGTYTENASGVSVVTGNNDKIGSAFADYDNDGDLDLWVPRYDNNQRGYLWRNDGGSFTDVTTAAGITNTDRQRSGAWGDVDNDGDLDLYVVTDGGDNILYQNNGDGTFSVLSAGAEAPGKGHDAVFVDYDNDGDLDLSITQEDATNTLLRNDLASSAYLKVRLIGQGDGATPVSANGVRVELWDEDGTTFIARRDLGVARGYGGAEPMWLHFGGVDPTETYRVRAYFQSGMTSVTVVPSDTSTTIGATTIPQMLTIEEGQGGGVVILRWVEVEP